jgi:hypothetical protein
VSLALGPRHPITGYTTARAIAASDEIALLALCCLLEHPLARGVDRSVISLALTTALGLPPVDVPLDRKSFGERIDVPVDRLPAVRSALIAAGLLVGFNVDDENDHAWVHVTNAHQPTLDIIERTIADS